MPTEKRQRQKEGRQARLLAQRKEQKRRQMLRRSVIVLVLAVIVAFSAYKIIGNGTHAKVALTPQQKANAAAAAAGCPASPSTRVNTLHWPSAPAMTIHPHGVYAAIVTTDLGPFTILLDAAKAPVTVNNFIFLAEHHYYNCVIFHRVIPSFMDQTGDPTGTGTGSPGYSIPDEYPAKAANPALQYPLGSVAMANTGQPHSGGAQFFIVAGPQGESLPNTYTLFGQVTSGMTVVEKINADGSASGVPPTVTHRMLRVVIRGG